MNGNERARRMQSYLPLLMQRGANLGRLLGALGNEFGLMEQGLERLMRARWYTHAEGYASEESFAKRLQSEIGRIGPLFGLFPGSNEDADFFRRHIAALVDVHRTGLTTAPALLRLVSLVYMAEQPPHIEKKGDDVAVGLFKIAGNDQLVRVEIQDSPTNNADAPFEGLVAGQDILVTNRGLHEAIPDISIRASAGGEVCVPILSHRESGWDLLFAGRIGAGRTLLIRHEREALLDGAPATGPIICSNPTRFYDAAHPSWPSNARARYDSLEAVFSEFEPSRSVPALIPGENHFHYDTLTRAELVSYLYGMPGAQQIIAALPATNSASASVNVQFRWAEATPATFVLRIPGNYVPPRFGEGGLPALIRELAQTLEYGRAAGVRASIEVTVPMLPEKVEVQDRPLAMDVSISFGEAGRVKDMPVVADSAMTLQDEVHPLQDDLVWDGVFDATRFSDSRFQ